MSTFLLAALAVIVGAVPIVLLRGLISLLDNMGIDIVDFTIWTIIVVLGTISCFFLGIAILSITGTANMERFL